MTHVNSQPVRRTWPVHVSHDIPGKPHLLNPSDPLVNVGDNGLEEVAVRRDDLAQVGQERVVDVVLPRGAVPRPTSILTHSVFHTLPELRVDRNGPPVWSILALRTEWATTRTRFSMA